MYGAEFLYSLSFTWSRNFYCLNKGICITICVVWTRYDIIMSSLKNSVHLLALNIHDCGHKLFQFVPILSQMDPLVFFPSYVLIRFRIVLSCARESSRRSRLCSFLDYFFLNFLSPNAGHGIFHFDPILGQMNSFTWSHYIYTLSHCPPMYSQNSQLISSY